MKKIKKIAASLMAVAAMATGMVGITASADVGKADFRKEYAEVWNVSGSTYNRLIIVSSTVYNKSTGTYVTVLSDSVVGPSGAVASVSHRDYANGYKFKCMGSVYNSNNSASGAAWSADPLWVYT